MTPQGIAPPISNVVAPKNLVTQHHADEFDRALKSKAMPAQPTPQINPQTWVQKIEKGQHAMDTVLRAALSDERLSPQQLLYLQAMTHHASFSLQSTAAIGKEVVSAIKTPLQQQI